MKRVVFVDAPGQADWIHASMPMDSATRLIAITASAVHRLEALGIPHTPVAAYADLHPLAAADEALNQKIVLLAAEIETYLGQHYAPVRFDGPGLLTGNSYSLQYSITAIVRRALLMRQAIHALAPSEVVAFDTHDDSWFSADGYARDPWLDVLRADSARDGFSLELLPSPAGPGLDRRVYWLNRLRHVRSRIQRGSRRLVDAMLRGEVEPPKGLAGLRLLFAPSDRFDWQPVIDLLKADGGAVCYRAPTFAPHRAGWAESFDARLDSLAGGQARTFDVARPTVDEGEASTLLDLWSEWESTHAPRSLDVAGIDVLPALRTQIREMLRWGPALIRYVDDVANRMLEVAQPHAVCFFSIGSLATRRLAFQCRQRSISVVSYQHGFGYSVRVQPQDEQSDPVHADYFLTYGDGNHPRPNPAFPVHARYVPVGSARIERMRRRRRQPARSARPKVLWASEYWTGNTLSVFITEETGRFEMYRRCLSRLAASACVDVTYRPYPGAADPLAEWIASAPSALKVNSTDRFEDLLLDCDLAVVATSSPTIWAEVLALDVPMILYCDPEQTLLTAEFMADLEGACRWCRSGDALLAEVERLAADGWQYVNALKQIDTAQFIRTYVLHRGHCSAKVAEFLNDVCRHARSVSAWEGSVYAAPAQSA